MPFSLFSFRSHLGDDAVVVRVRNTITTAGETIAYFGVFADRGQKPFHRIQTVIGNAREQRTPSYAGVAVSAGRLQTTVPLCPSGENIEKYKFFHDCFVVL